MNIPTFTNSKVVDENGYFTPEWSNLMNTLISQVQLNLGNEGYVVPQQPATNIAELTDASKSTGAIVYNSTDNTMMGNIDGTWKTFTLT
jgi:hypothetical protein